MLLLDLAFPVSIILQHIAPFRIPMVFQIFITPTYQVEDLTGNEDIRNKYMFSKY